MLKPKGLTIICYLGLLLMPGAADAGVWTAAFKWGKARVPERKLEQPRQKLFAPESPAQELEQPRQKLFAPESPAQVESKKLPKKVEAPAKIAGAETQRNSYVAFKSVGHSNSKKYEVFQWKVDRKNLKPRELWELNSGRRSATAPLLVRNTILLQFKPKVTEEQKKEFLDAHALTISKKFDISNTVLAEGDLSRFFDAKPDDKSTNDAVVRGFQLVKAEFEKDDRIIVVAPDVLLRKQANEESSGASNLLSAFNVFVPEKNIIDWGVKDIQADQVWNSPGAEDAVIFGIMDVGFRVHHDLAFVELPANTPPENHGNHVAGIACGRHQNPVGIWGVLPNCFVRVGTGEILLYSPQVGGDQAVTFFSQVIFSFEEFLLNHHDIRTINISMGYNWRLFGINPDVPESEFWRNLVKAQGEVLVPSLKYASERGIVFFSAAGNDSDGLNDPINAKYASPFNWAAIKAREQNIAKNGVIVEAHNKDGARAEFSNRGGDISCPGVDVVSAVAFDQHRQPTRSALGTMSGTSQATPYCAAGYALIKLVKPGISSTDAITCMMNTSKRSSAGTPMLRLTDALKACPPHS